jgi:1-acyl-sn-glycerol-3-phosphate acyltransferase
MASRWTRSLIDGTLPDVKDWFYFLVYFLGYPPMILASATTVLHRDRVRRKGAFILASNHFSPYDNACLIKETPRVLNFVSIVELFKHPLARWFLTNIGATPLDRSKKDSATVRIIMEKLKKGRVIAIFPEASIRTEETSVLNGGRLKPGVGRIAKMAGVPIIPCVIVGARGFHTFKNWLPFRRIKIGLIYGEPITVGEKSDADAEGFEERLRQTYLDLHEELKEAMRK